MAFFFRSFKSNQLSGTFPEMYSTDLSVVMLHSNNFQGRVPAFIAERFIENPFDDLTTFVTLHNNFFSCQLPSSGINATYKFKALVASGNQISAGLACFIFFPFATLINTTPMNKFSMRITEHIPLWVPKVEREATSLFVPCTPQWVWVVVMLGSGGCVLVLGLLRFVGWRPAALLQDVVRVIRADVLHSRLEEALLSHASQNEADDTLDTQNNSVLVVQRLCGICITIPTLFGFAFLLPLYVKGSNLYECGRDEDRLSVVTLIDAYGLEWAVAVCICIQMCMATVAVVWLRCRVAELLTTNAAHRELIKYLELTTPASALDNNESVTHTITVAGVLKLVFHTLLWLLGVIALNVPVAIYLVFENMPTNNKLSVPPELLSLIVNIFPVILALISAVAIPLLCRVVFAPWHKNDGFSSLEILALLVSRWLTVIIVPLAVAVVIEESCFSKWHLLWSPCTPDSTEFDFADNINYPILSNEEVCNPPYFTGRCPRRVISSTSLLLIQKLALETTVRPLITVFAATSAWTRSRFRVLFQRYGVLCVASAATVQTITWVEIALVYTAVSPLVGVLAWIAVWVNYIVSQVLVVGQSSSSSSSSGGGGGGGGFFVSGLVVAQLKGGIPVWWIGMSLIAMCVVVCWCWIENELGGWQCIVGTVACGSVAAAWFCVRHAHRERSKLQG